MEHFNKTCHISLLQSALKRPPDIDVEQRPRAGRAAASEPLLPRGELRDLRGGGELHRRCRDTIGRVVLQTAERKEARLWLVHYLLMRESCFEVATSALI